jgi:peroxiredoxin
MKKFMFLFSGVLLLASFKSPDSPLKPGDEATDFTLKSVKGEMVTLSKIENVKGYIVVFTSNTCPFAKKYEKRVIDLNNEFSSKGYPVIAVLSNDENVDPDDSFEAMTRIAKDKGYTFQYLRDENQDVARRYGATNTPHAYVLSKKSGVLKVEYVGAIDNNVDDPSQADKKYVADAVNSLLSGKPVMVKETRAIGCNLKWKNQ